MKHWIEGDGEIYLKDQAGDVGRVVCIGKDGITEMCDDYFRVRKTKEGLIEALEEALAWAKIKHEEEVKHG